MATPENPLSNAGPEGQQPQEEQIVDDARSLENGPKRQLRDLPVDPESSNTPASSTEKPYRPPVLQSTFTPSVSESTTVEKPYSPPVLQSTFTPSVSESTTVHNVDESTERPYKPPVLQSTYKPLVPEKIQAEADVFETLTSKGDPCKIKCLHCDHCMINDYVKGSDGNHTYEPPCFTNFADLVTCFGLWSSKHQKSIRQYAATKWSWILGALLVSACVASVVFQVLFQVLALHVPTQSCHIAAVLTSTILLVCCLCFATTDSGLWFLLLMCKNRWTFVSSVVLAVLVQIWNGFEDLTFMTAVQIWNGFEDLTFMTAMISLITWLVSWNNTIIIALFVVSCIGTWRACTFEMPLELWIQYWTSTSGWIVGIFVPLECFVLVDIQLISQFFEKLNFFQFMLTILVMVAAACAIGYFCIISVGTPFQWICLPLCIVFIVQKLYVLDLNVAVIVLETISFISWLVSRNNTIIITLFAVSCICIRIREGSIKISIERWISMNGWLMGIFVVLQCFALLNLQWIQLYLLTLTVQQFKLAIFVFVCGICAVEILFTKAPGKQFQWICVAVSIALMAQKLYVFEVSVQVVVAVSFLAQKLYAFEVSVHLVVAVSFLLLAFVAGLVLQGNYLREDILKAIVYGGLWESITSLSVISWAVAADASIWNVITLGAGNVFVRGAVSAHSLWELGQGKDEGRYKEKLGDSKHFALHIALVVASYFFCGLLPPTVYAYAMASGHHELKYFSAVISLVFIFLLAFAKAKAEKISYGSVTRYIVFGACGSIVSWFASSAFNVLQEKYGDKPCRCEPCPEITC